MDSITHIALGACMGEAFAGHKLGRRAMLWGAMAQSVPDIDFLASLWMDTASNLLAHRGFTHSVLFCGLITPILALLAERWHRPHNISFFKWCVFFGAVIFAHIFLDAFNNYGVGWFEPFSQKRISFNIIYVADPLFSIAPGLVLIMLIAGRGTVLFRKKWSIIALAISAFYLCYALVNKINIDRFVKKDLAAQQIPYARYFTTPASFQNWLWYVVAGDDKGYHIGYRSVFDKIPHIDFEYFPRNDSLLASQMNYETTHKLIRFSQQFYTVELNDDGLLFNDLRFGQVMGWSNPCGKFVFYYYLDEKHDNTLVVQRGRFEGWDPSSLRTLWRRMKGVRQ